MGLVAVCCDNKGEGCGERKKRSVSEAEVSKVDLRVISLKALFASFLSLSWPV